MPLTGRLQARQTGARPFVRSVFRLILFRHSTRAQLSHVDVCAQRKGEPSDEALAAAYKIAHSLAGVRIRATARPAHKPNSCPPILTPAQAEHSFRRTGTPGCEWRTANGSRRPCGRSCGCGKRSRDLRGQQQFGLKRKPTEWRDKAPSVRWHVWHLQCERRNSSWPPTTGRGY